MTNAMIEVGKKAPAFSLPDATGAKRSLAEFAGRWIVLYFYPKDDTPGCTREARDFTADLLAFEKLDAAVLGCSPDSPDRHAKFAAKHSLHVTLLSDPQHRALEAYGAWGEKTNYGKTTIGVIRSTVLIDPKGKIAHRWPKVKVDGHAEAVRNKLAELRG
jgi:thioredoxin-dependent peroxiredoxin